MVTGVWPVEHGIYANTLFDPLLEHKGEWYWYLPRAEVADALSGRRQGRFDYGGSWLAG